MRFKLLLAFLTLGFNADLVGQVRLNEVMSENETALPDEDGDFSDWVELYNSGSTTVNLAGFSLSDDSSEPQQWTFPFTLLAPNEHLVVFCSGKNRLTGPYLHTNFKLKSSGEELILSDGNYLVLDYVKATPLTEDFALARVIDGEGSWERFSDATPNDSNQHLSGVVFSAEPGYHSGEFMLALESTLGHEIRYTLNGNLPDTNSALFTDSISITDLVGTPSPYSEIVTSNAWDEPTGEFPKMNVVRAQSFLNGEPTSQVFTKSYFVDEEIADYLQHYPVVSIVTDSLCLFDYDTGIYVQGANYNPGNSQWTGNYFMKGEEWERVAHIEYFNSEELTWSQNFGLRIQGGKTRGAPQKSLRFYSRGDLGAKKFNHQFFETKDKQVFDKFSLRAHFGCWNHTMIKDGLTGYVARNLDFDSQHSQPVIVFINGEYWGIHTVRDYYDSTYFEEEYDVDEDSVNIVLHGSGMNPNQDGTWGIVEGTNLHYLALHEFIENNPLSAPENYEYIATQLDVSSMIDYFCTAIYFNHRDWPSNNHKQWRSEGDSKWRWMLYDFDSGWGYSSVSNNSILYAAHPTGSTIYNTPYTTYLFRNMLESEEFRLSFIERYACLMNNEFHPDTVANAIDLFEEMYDANAEQHINRWHHTSSYGNWQSRINSKLRSFNNNRRQYAINHVSSWFNIDFDPDDYNCNSIITDSPEVEKEVFMVYPNPTSDVVWIDWPRASASSSFYVLDVNGRIVQSGNYSFHQQLDVTGFDAGIYFVVLEDGIERKTAKFVVN